MDKIKINSDRTDRIQQLIKDPDTGKPIKDPDTGKPRPFKNVQDFVDRAVEVWLVWEENPQGVIELMNNYRKTKAQSDIMIGLMRSEKISVKDGQVTITDEKFGDVGTSSIWIDRTERIKQLIKNPDKRPFENVQEFVDKAVEVWLAWEENPQSVIDIFNRYRKTKAQNQMMQDLMRSEIITEEGGQTTITDEKFGNVDPDTTQYFLDELRTEGHRKLTSIRENLELTKKYINEKNVYNIPKEKLTIQYESFEDEFPLLWRYYSRIFPAKVIITLLANLMHEQKIDYVNLEVLRTEGLKVCLGILEEIEKYEKNSNITKTNKISTGFPNRTTTEDNTGSDTLDHVRQQTKQDQINQRFQDRFIGKIEETAWQREIDKRKFAGILSALGIVKCFTNVTRDEIIHGSTNVEYYVTLTEFGKNFFLISNPLIEKPIDDKSNEITPFSGEEVDLIMKMGKLRLEKMIIDDILEKMKSGNPPFDADNITGWMKNKIQEFVEGKKKEKLWLESAQGKLFKTELKNYTSKDITRSRISSWRAATMGRLAELGKIKWQINKNGKSEYSLNQD